MLQAAIISVVIFLASGQNLFCTLFGKKYAGEARLSSAVFCVLESIFISLFTWVWIGFQFHLSPISLLLGVINAVVLFIYNTSIIKAGSSGSYSFMTVSILSGGIIVPLIYSLLFENTALKFYQIGAIILMVGSFILMNFKDIKLKGTPWHYYLFCGLLFFANGSYSVMLKLQTKVMEAEKNEMLIITYLLMGLIALGQMLIREKKETFKAFKIGKKAILPLILCCLCVSLSMNLQLIIMPFVDIAIMMTMLSGGILVVSAGFSIFIFKEKLDLYNILGLILAAVSITALSI